MEQQLQPLLAVVEAELVEGGAALPAARARVLQARRVQHYDGVDGVGRTGDGPVRNIRWKWIIQINIG